MRMMNLMIELITGVKSDKGRREPSILRENYICRFGMDHGAHLQNVLDGILERSLLWPKVIQKIGSSPCFSSFRAYWCFSYRIFF